MECRGCPAALGSEGKDGLCLACRESLDRWIFERIAEEQVRLEVEAAANEEQIRKGA